MFFFHPLVELVVDESLTVDAAASVWFDVDIMLSIFLCLMSMPLLIRSSP